MKIVTYKRSSCIGRRDIDGVNIELPKRSPRWLPYHPPTEDILDFTSVRQARENFAEQSYADCDQEYVQR